MTTDWLLRVGDGENVIASKKHKIWGIQSSPRANKYFIKTVKPGDRLWFVKNNSHGKLFAVASYDSHNERLFGPLIDISMTNEELGWRGGPEWTSEIEIHYTDLYILDKYELLTHIKSPLTIRKYDEKCKVNLNEEYKYIMRYCKSDV